MEAPRGVFQAHLGALPDDVQQEVASLNGVLPAKDGDRKQLEKRQVSA